MTATNTETRTHKGAGSFYAYVEQRATELAREHLERNGMRATPERVEQQSARFMKQAIREAKQNPYLRANDPLASSRAQMKTRANTNNHVVKSRIKPRTGYARRLADTPAVTEDDEYLTSITSEESARLLARNEEIIRQSKSWRAA